MTWDGYDDDPPDDLTIIGLDPGTHTGWCVISLDRRCLPTAKSERAGGPNKAMAPAVLNSIMFYQWGEIGGSLASGGSGESEHEQVEWLEGMLDAWPNAAIVREDFILRTSISDREVLSPVRIGFALDHLLWERSRRVFLQQPAMAKTTATDERLKSWGLYRPGSAHAKDATRHAITFARRLRGSNALLKEAFPFLG